MIDNPWGNQGAVTKRAAEPRRLGGPSPKFSAKVGEKFERTKEVASGAAKKVKNGASSGVHWLKVKCHKNKLFQKH